MNILYSGDVNTISIGSQVSVGDRAMIHCSGIGKNAPTKIGNKVTIGAGTIIHGCTLEDECVIGDGAQVLDGAKVERQAMVGGGSIVTQGKVVPSGQLWAGTPAVFVRALSPAEIKSIDETVQTNLEWASKHAAESLKTWDDIEQELYEFEQINNRSDQYYQRLTPEEMSFKLGEQENHEHPGRILDSDGKLLFYSSHVYLHVYSLVYSQRS